MKILVIALIALLIAVPVGLYFTGVIQLGGGGAEEAAGEHAPAAAGHGEAAAGVAPVYLTLDPPFVVNFTHRGTLRYLQVSLDVSYPDATLLDKVKERMPAIRNDLIMLFSNQDYEVISTMVGKEKLRRDILRAINRVIGIETAAPAALVAEHGGAEGSASGVPADMAAYGAPAPIGQVYITNFVMQ